MLGFSRLSWPDVSPQQIGVGIDSRKISGTYWLSQPEKALNIFIWGASAKCCGWWPKLLNATSPVGEKLLLWYRQCGSLLVSCQFLVSWWGEAKPGGGYQCFLNFHHENCGNDPTWLAHIFQMGWFNNQLDYFRQFWYIIRFFHTKIWKTSNFIHENPLVSSHACLPNRAGLIGTFQ